MVAIALDPLSGPHPWRSLLTTSASEQVATLSSSVADKWVLLDLLSCAFGLSMSTVVVGSAEK